MLKYGNCGAADLKKHRQTGANVKENLGHF
jgi:hypothetical protein